MTYIKPGKNIPVSIFVGAMILLLQFLVSGCKSGPALDPMFTVLQPEQSGIHFRNDLHEDSSNNILDYLYFYNGGGVAVGDINNDGLPDVFFTSNQGNNKLYLNKGNLQFEDISATAGIEGAGKWKTGVTMADVNGDGLLDVYVSVVGHYKSFNGHNELFINKGNGQFSEESLRYGLGVEGFNTQASFFDYDRDGDLDVFIVNHSVHSTETYVDSSERRKRNEYAGDKLLRCDQAGDSIYFTEVTEVAGIYSSALGFGLNVLTGDFNNDNWPDIYVSNDFHENDYYYINNRNGTFSELNQQSFGHESRFSMGSDLGDINNDGWLDLITLDMLPEDEKVLKSSASDDGLDIYAFKMSKGYHHQYSKNSLQLNTNGGLHFSDISLAAGVAATDWSWSPLFADFDNDGIQDLFISNGILRRPNDIDYIKYISSGTTRELLQSGRSADLDAIKKMPSGAVANKLYKGNSQLGFADSSAAWGINKAGFSNGAIYADLDIDGDLDIVVNNLNEPAGIYINRLINRTRDNIATQPRNGSLDLADKSSHYLDVKLHGKGMNRFGYGSRISISSAGKRQTKYITASHGFQSGFAGGAHFGIGAAEIIDSLEIWWPDSTVQLLTRIPVDTIVILEQTAATLQPPNLLPTAAGHNNQLLETLSSQQTGIAFRHRENNFVDFDIQQLIPHQLSTQGPKMAVADVNNDGLEDLFICGAAGQAGKLFLQQNNSRFLPLFQPAIQNDSAAEDVDAAFFDADADGDKDLYIVSGGGEYCGKETVLLDRLYINDSKGRFTRSDGLPQFYGNKSVVVPIDFDRDGDLDLFVGGRVDACSYGRIPDSYLLINEGSGRFSIAPDSVAPGLKNIGMVSAACNTDIDKDGWPDIVIVGSWMPVTIFKNNNGTFFNATKIFGLQNTTGLWNTILARDLNGDGYEELLAGNWGFNSKLRAETQHPLQLFAGDIDKNGAWDQVLTVEKNGQYYPFLGKEELEKVLPGPVRKKYRDYGSMAGQTVEQVFPGIRSSGITFSTATLGSVIIHNINGKLRPELLPGMAQWSPIFAFETGDIDGNGSTDILSGGNFYGVLPFEGRYDANAGTVLLNNADSYNALLPIRSGFITSGETRDIKAIRIANEQWFAVAGNNDPLRFYKRLSKPATQPLPR